MILYNNKRRLLPYGVVVKDNVRSEYRNNKKEKNTNSEKKKKREKEKSTSELKRIRATGGFVIRTNTQTRTRPIDKVFFVFESLIKNL